jgi:hypothetical protein
MAKLAAKEKINYNWLAASATGIHLSIFGAANHADCSKLLRCTN